MENFPSFQYSDLVPYYPPHWLPVSNKSTALFEVDVFSDEFRQVAAHFRMMPRKIVRHQNLNQYAMFLIRQQHLQYMYENMNLYMVTRYCSIDENKVTSALQYNLDERRLMDNIEFNISPRNLSSRQATLVVSLLTTEMNFDQVVAPERDADIYIDYIVYL